MTEISEPNFYDEFKFHHIGILVQSIAQSLEHYSVLFGKDNISEPIYISSQKVNVCFIKNGNNSSIELIEPTEEKSVVYKLLKKHVSYYHIGYKVKDIRHTIDKLERLNYKILQIFNSEAFGGNQCVFLFTPEAYLIELIQN
jgi:methylmalonyl-CoA/ethylmalonyl-CoA epimerase